MVEKVTTPLRDLRENPDNPRTITDAQLEKLERSLLVFPAMMDLRPIVVDKDMVVLGGNQRLKALRAIAEMSEDEVYRLLDTSTDYKAKSTEERYALLERWNKWRDDPSAPVVKADTLSEGEKRQFIIKDNVGFGEWDVSALEKDWQASLLDEWGVDDVDKLFADPVTPEESATAKLSNLEYSGMYYEPEETPRLTLEQCVDTSKYDAKVRVIEESTLTEAQKAVMKLFAYRFLKINFEAVANYYAFNASAEEKRVIERLRMVLVDGGIDGFIEDDILRVRDIILNEEDSEAYE